MRGKVTQLEWAIEHKDFDRILRLRVELVLSIEELSSEVAYVKKYNLMALPWHNLFKNVEGEIEVANNTLQMASSLKPLRIVK